MNKTSVWKLSSFWDVQSRHGDFGTGASHGHFASASFKRERSRGATRYGRVFSMSEK
jgi:hypothetical protein